MCECDKFQAKQTTLTFSVQICPKMDLGLEIQKTNESASSRCHACQFSGKTNNFDFFDQNLPKKESEFQKSKCKFGICILEIPYAPIFIQNEQL